MDNDDILKPDSDGFYGTEKIALLLNLTTDYTRQQAQKGILPSVKSNGKRRFELVPTVQSYVKYLRERTSHGEFATNEDGEIIGGFCDTKMLAKMLDIAESSVKYAVEQNILPAVKSNGKRRFELVPAVQSYVRYLRERTSNGKFATNEDGEIIGGFCDTQMIAKILGIAESSVIRATQKGILSAINGNGYKWHFELIPTIQSYVKYLREKAQNKPESSNSDLQRRKLEADIALKEKRVQYLDGQLVRDFPHKSRKAAKKEQMRNEISRMSTEEIYALLEKLDEEEEDEEDDET